ncbi:MAG TPA: hypothetical protein VLG16_01610 [Candidatus Saccharimonadales bacterium]|nr:hypothetical protein [Candidatus Saccharimonadales bacterium]
MSAEFAEPAKLQGEAIFRQYSPEYDAGRCTIFNELGSLGMAQETWAMQGSLYRDMAIVSAETPDKNDWLPANLDLMRDRVAGQSATRYYVWQENEHPDQKASVRLQLLESYEDLPTYLRCNGNIYRENKTLLKKMVKDGYVIAEAGSFARTQQADSVSMHRVLREMIRDSVDGLAYGADMPEGAQNATIPTRQAPQKQAWLIGMVTRTFDTLELVYGRRNLWRIGGDTFFDPRVNFALRYGLLMPNDFVNNLHLDYLEAHDQWQHAQKYGRDTDPRIYQRLQEKFLLFTDGLGRDTSHMSNEAWDCQNQLRKQQPEKDVA